MAIRLKRGKVNSLVERQGWPNDPGPWHEWHGQITKATGLAAIEYRQTRTDANSHEPGLKYAHPCWSIVPNAIADTWNFENEKNEWGEVSP